MKKITIYLVSTVLSLGLFAANKDISVNSTVSNSSSTSGKTNVGSCNPSTNQIDLDINNIRARLLGGGDFWWDGVNNPFYEYPKIDQTTGELSRSVIFSGAMWFTGLDDGNNLRCAAQTYRNIGHDFWTGPLELGGEIPDQVCANFDHHFVVLGKEIIEFREKYAASGSSISPGDIPENVLYWPGKGNPHLLNSSTLNKWYFNDGSLAPFFDANADGIYNPVNGDFPVIKPCAPGIEPAFADQMIFWVINDNGNSHARSNGVAMGVQVNCLAFGYQTSDEINDMTFYTFEILKKTSGNLSQTYMGIFVDPDLGNATDDLIGCDTVRSIGFCYNGNNNDGDYGAGPPIVAIDYFEGPLDDNGDELGMSSFVYFNNASGNQSDPDDAPEFRNYQTGKWKDGSPITCGGNGIGGSIQTNYVYPASPHLPAGGGDCDFWSEASEGNTPADRRWVQNSGPFTLSSAQSQRISIGVMVGETDPSTYNAQPDIEAIIGVADNKAQALFDNCFGIEDGPDAPSLKIREMSNQLVINLINETSSNNYGESYTSPVAGAVLGATDTAYNFEGYMVFQLKDNSVTAKDLTDPSKAKLIFQTDIKNGVSNVFNYALDNVSQMYIPDLKVSGNNNGIQRSFVVTDDAFANENTELVNFNTYYFASIAYAFNNHKQFNPADPLSATAQLQQYLQGRRNFNVYSAIPHNVESEVGGTQLNCEYGQGLLVKRLEGQGNGGKNLELTQESKDAILQSNFEDVVEYEPLFDPIGVKIVDPLTVQNVDFELRIKNDVVNVITDTSYWELEVFKEGQSVETIKSVRNMERPFEQIIEEYGISLNVGNPLEVYVNEENGNFVYDMISSSIAFEDESKRWLSFIIDGSNGSDLSPSNWIRSGSFVNSSHLEGVYDSHQYDHIPGAADIFYDSLDIFANIIDAGFAPYCLASNYKKDAVVANTGEPEIFTPYSVFGPAFLWDEYGSNPPLTATESCDNPKNTLDKLQSVDIVLTDDKTKWSKCVVFETGEFDNQNVGGSRKGQIRNQASIDENGNESGADIGYSYFPGYAINLETGERLNIAFGENSAGADDNGADMIWNPTSSTYSKHTDIPGNEDTKIPIWGGQHYIYVFETRYDAGLAMHEVLTNPVNYNNVTIPTAVEEVYESIMYTSVPVLNKEFEYKSYADGLIPNDVTIKIRVETPYEKLLTSELKNDTLPRYSFSTVGLAPEFNNAEVAESALDNIRVVPNPYYAYSTYEVSPNSNIVKITNLPDVCEVSIFTLDGKLVRKFDRAVGNGGNTESSRQDLSLGQVTGIANLNNSIDWNLKNHKDIPVASGTYLIYVNAPGVGETVVKSAVFIRPPDVTNF